ncbi:MAG: methyltransferase family protein [Woeseiaceae bacterium]
MKHTFYDLHRSRAGHKTLQHRLVQLRPPRIAMVLTGAAAILHFVIPLTALPSWRVAAILTGLTGFVIMLRAWWLFRIAETAICPTEQATTLITGDVYAVTRNPMYLGIVLMLFGLALYTGSLAFYAAAVTNFLVLNFVFCPYEENRLNKSFDAFSSYASSVPRWI